MVTMTEPATTWLPHGRPLTRADLDALPDDGHRYELIDGVLIVTPAPATQHQRVSARLFRVLDRNVPADQEVLYAPVDVPIGDTTVLQPDLLVARISDIGERDVPALLLAIEILSPSTRRTDLTLKRSRYEEAGVPSYWVVDPDALTLTAWELDGKKYVEVANVSGEETFEAELPFPVAITPNRLRD